MSSYSCGILPIFPRKGRTEGLVNMDVADSLSRAAGSFLLGEIKSKLLPRLDNSIPVGRLERHLDDYRKGRGNLSRDTGRKISSYQLESETRLTEINPRVARDYSSYLTALTYDQRARFVNSVRSANEDLRPLQTKSLRRVV